MPATFCGTGAPTVDINNQALIEEEWMQVGELQRGTSNYRASFHAEPRIFMKRPDIEAQLRDAKAGDILLFYRARGINRIITAFSRSRYYHIGIYAGDYYVVESRPRGVLKRNLRLPGGGHYFRVIPAPGGAEVGRKALEYAERQVGDGYAVLSVFGLVFDRIFDFAHINLRQRDRYSCGELVAQAFAEAGKPLFPGRPVELVAPWDFARFLSRTRTKKQPTS